MNTILNVASTTEADVMSNGQIYMVLVPICVIIAIVAIYRTAVANRKPESDKH